MVSISLGATIFTGVHNDWTEYYSTRFSDSLRDLAIQSRLYNAMWKPVAHGFKYAGDIIPSLTAGIAVLGLMRDECVSSGQEASWQILIEAATCLRDACVDRPLCVLEVHK